MKQIALALLLAATALAQDTFQATLDGPLWKEKSGELRFTAEGIAFQPKGDKEPMRWEYADIQLFDLVSRTELHLLTYEDSKWKLGRDRELRFQLAEGEISEELFGRIRARLSRPVNDRVLEHPTEAEYQIPVKHLHPIGGCEGELLFFDDRIVYDSNQDKHDRDWAFESTVEGVWSSDPYELEIEVREPRAGKPGEIRTWRYQLKQRLDPDLYERLKRRMYSLR